MLSQSLLQRGILILKMKAQLRVEIPLTQTLTKEARMLEARQALMVQLKTKKSRTVILIATMKETPLRMIEKIKK